jgi:hypothetical protein
MSHPVGMSTFRRRGDVQVTIEVGVGVGGLREVERILHGLNMGVPSMRIHDVPLHLQRHTGGVSEGLSHLLRRGVRAVMCYLENNVVHEDE